MHKLQEWDVDAWGMTFEQAVGHLDGLTVNLKLTLEERRACYLALRMMTEYLEQYKECGEGGPVCGLPIVKVDSTES